MGWREFVQEKGGTKNLTRHELEWVNAEIDKEESGARAAQADAQHARMAANPKVKAATEEARDITSRAEENIGRSQKVVSFLEGIAPAEARYAVGSGLNPDAAYRMREAEAGVPQAAVEKHPYYNFAGELAQTAPLMAVGGPTTAVRGLGSASGGFLPALGRAMSAPTSRAIAKPVSAFASKASAPLAQRATEGALRAQLATIQSGTTSGRLKSGDDLAGSMLATQLLAPITTLGTQAASKGFDKMRQMGMEGSRAAPEIRMMADKALRQSQQELARFKDSLTMKQPAPTPAFPAQKNIYGATVRPAQPASAPRAKLSVEDKGGLALRKEEVRVKGNQLAAMEEAYGDRAGTIFMTPGEEIAERAGRALTGANIVGAGIGAQGVLGGSKVIGAATTAAQLGKGRMRPATAAVIDTTSRVIGGAFPGIQASISRAVQSAEGMGLSGIAGAQIAIDLHIAEALKSGDQEKAAALQEAKRQISQ